MAESPLVSAIIIFLNAERFLDEAIESVFRQSYAHWELLLVDDGSTDGSTLMAERVARAHPATVRYLEHPGHQNRGHGASRNLGIAHARGAYVAFLDADDVWYPHTLEQQVTILEAHPDVALVYGAYRYWRSWRGEPEDRPEDTLAPLGVDADRVIRPPELLARTYAERKATVPTASVVAFRREVATRLGGFEDFRIFEDQTFYVKVFLAEAVFVSSRCWARYRLHDDSSMAVAIESGQYAGRWRAFLAWFEAYLSGHGMKGTVVWRAVRGAHWRARHPRAARLLERSVTVARHALPRLQH